MRVDVEQRVRLMRLDLDNQGFFCGAQAIRWELEDQGLVPLPSLRTINRILRRKKLTDRPTGEKQPSGKQYPSLGGASVNYVHQADFFGPCYLRGPIRFYSLNAVDLSTGRCGIEPLIYRSAQPTIDAFWAIWRRLGLPTHLQVDNEMTFYGSPTHPRGMGTLIRLGLHCGIEVWFIPPREPWRNGVVEKFNHHYRQKFLRRVKMTSADALRHESLCFEQRHNRAYRYSKLKGCTPMQALAMSQKPLRFPIEQQAPRHPLPKPESGRYHLVRFIRSDARLDVFGEKFVVPNELVYEYVVATIDVKEQKLKLYLDKVQVDEIDYRLF